MGALLGVAICDLVSETEQPMNSVFLENLHHAYAQTDGSYAFPNSREGDMLKRAKLEIEALKKVIDNPKCRCGEDSTGWTMVKLCNICGLPHKSEVMPWNFHIANAKDVAAAETDAQPNQTACSPSPRSAC